jgi:hypothetical protein
MYRDTDGQAGSTARHAKARREFGLGGPENHDRGVREHARMATRARRSEAVRVAEAERQIRELRGRY